MKQQQLLKLLAVLSGKGFSKQMLVMSCIILLQ